MGGGACSWDVAAGWAILEDTGDLVAGGKRLESSLGPASFPLLYAQQYLDKKRLLMIFGPMSRESANMTLWHQIEVGLLICSHVVELTDRN